MSLRLKEHREIFYDAEQQAFYNRKQKILTNSYTVVVSIYHQDKHYLQYT